MLRQLFTIYIIVFNKKRIVAKIENPALANYFYGIIGITWLCEKINVPLEFVFPKEKTPFFENTILKEKSSSQHSAPNSFLINDLSTALASTARRVARKDIAAEYGHKVLSQLSIKQSIQQQAKEWINAHLKSDWVAVHYRGTDAYTDPKLHNRNFSIDLYIAWLKKVLSPQCEIFACSDQAQFIDKMQSAYVGRAYFRKIKRSTDSQTLHLSKGTPCSAEDIYQQRLDALLDVLIMSESSLIYTTGSGFVDMVRHFNPQTKIISLDGRKKRRIFQNYLPIPEEAFLQTLLKEN